MSAVLVTGGAGFIGSHLVDGLLAAGERVRVLDNLDPLAHPGRQVPEYLSPEAELVVGDLRDRETVNRALSGVDRVFHLGGVVGNGESMVHVRKAVDVNSGGTATLLEAIVARRDAVRRVVVASSMVVYGDGAYRCEKHGVQSPEGRSAERLARRRWEPVCPRCGREVQPMPTSEYTPLRPLSVYGITKRDQEELALVVGRAYGVETVALRYLGTYGPRQALGNPYTGVAAIFAARVIAGMQPLVFEDGAQMRDLVHVSDVVRATMAAMDVPEAPGQALNVGTGRGIGIADLAIRIARALGLNVEPEVTGEFRAGDIRHCFADTTLAAQKLGFEAHIALEEGVAELARWVAGQESVRPSDGALADLRARGLLS